MNGVVPGKGAYTILYGIVAYIEPIYLNVFNALLYSRAQYTNSGKALKYCRAT